MGLIETVVTVLKRTGAWAAKNPERAMVAVQKIESLYSGKKFEPNNHGDRILVLEQRVNQLSEKIEKQNKKMDVLYREVQAKDQKIRKLQIWLTITGITLTLAVVAIGVFAFCL